MKFIKRIKLKRDARYIASSAVLHNSTNTNQPGDLFGDLKVIGSLTEGLARLESKHEIDNKDREAIVDGVREELKSLFIPYKDLEGLVEFSKNFLDGENEDNNISTDSPSTQMAEKKYVVENTLNFIQISILMIDKKTLNKELPKVGSCMYFAGAASYLAKKCSLEDEQLGNAVLEIIKDYGLSHDNALFFVKSINTLLTEPLGKEAFREGFDAIRTFSEEENDKAALRLKRLVDQWAEQ